MRAASSYGCTEEIAGRLDAAIGLELDAAPCISEAARHAVQGGSRMRALLLLESCDFPGPALQAAVALELLHGATLIQDDILDQGSRRHGRPCTYLRFGAGPALLSSDWLLVRALELAVQVDLRLFRRMSGGVQEMICTETRELGGMGPGTDTGAGSVEDVVPAILGVAAGKTGGLFGLALYAAALLRGSLTAACETAEQLGVELGTTYQLLDDARDVFMSEQDAGKAVRQDLPAGRLTLPIFFALQQAGLRDRHGFPLSSNYRQIRARLKALDAHEMECVSRAMHAPEVHLRLRRLIQQRMARHRRAAALLEMRPAFARWEQQLAPVLAACHCT